jgi:hypothetical protein
MRAKAELSRDAFAKLVAFSKDDQRDFWRQLQRVCEQPVTRSELVREAGLSRYATRAFEFGTGMAKSAVFEFDATRQRIWVLECRLAKPRRIRPKESD